MRTYEDIQTLTCVATHETPADLDRLCSATDLRQEIQHVLDREDEPWELWRAGASNEESILVLWCPDLGRAGLAWGADAEWTDADSVDDALQRYFGVDGKAMAN